MATAELERALALQRGLLQDFAALQTPEDFRALYSRFLGQFPADPAVRVEPVDAGGVPAEWMVPPGAMDARVILYLHGGGYVIGSPTDYRALVPRIAHVAEARALVLDYRLAPEHPFPAAVDDAVAAYRWLLAQEVAPDRIALAGDSAGGGLTIAALVAIRDAELPRPAAGVAISPWVDLEATGASMETNAAADPLVQKELLLNMAAAYLPDQDPHSALAAPLYAELAGLPPLLLQVGGAETLLDDTRRLAERARAAGVEVTDEVWPEMPHVWHMFASFLPDAAQACEQAGTFIKRHTGAAITA